MPVASVVVGASAAVVAIPVMLSTDGTVLVIKSVEVSSKGTVYLLERASDGAQVSVQVASGGAVLVPTPEVQTQLLKVLRDEPRSVSLPHKPYSMVSYAWSQKYQQSNQWAIETLALAIGGTDRDGQAGREQTQAQAWLQARDYQLTPLKISALTRLGGGMTVANIAFDDDPNAKRFSDRIETVTVDSVFDWMQRAKLTAQPVATLR